jgi:hypothetical protein
MTKGANAVRKFAAGVIIGVIVGMLGLAGAQTSRSPWHPYSSGVWGFSTGNDLVSLPETFRLGYVAGAYDAFVTVVQERDQLQDLYYGNGLRITAENGSEPKQRHEYLTEAADNALLRLSFLRLSIPTGVTLGQLEDVVGDYLDSHPAERQNSAALLVWRALAEAEWK